MDLDENGPQTPLVALTASIVAAYVQKHIVPSSGLRELICRVHKALLLAAPSGLVKTQPLAEKQKPAISVRKSITADYIICLEDGKSYKSLKRHLSAKYGMTPDDYRAKWALPDDYPMVAPAYAAKRSELARSHGLGQIRAKS
jgi:predicted transcriptional regulator